MAYTGSHINTQTNPFLAYTGMGGSSIADNIRLPDSVDVMSPKNMSGLYGSNPALPNPGPTPIGNANIPTNMGSMKFGGSSCGSCMNVTMTGGTCSTCNSPLITGGGNCGCGLLKGGKKQKIGKKQKGGQTIDPQGLIGNPWTSSPATWPDVDSVAGNRNYLQDNIYKADPQTALISVGANRPFLFGGRKKHTIIRRNRNNKKTKRRRQRGGNGSNLLSQDFINLGRQIQYNVGSTYNALNGYALPKPVLPWQGQLAQTPNLTTMRGAAL